AVSNSTLPAMQTRFLVTLNRADCERLHRQWLEAGRRHAGIIIAWRRQPGELTVQLGRLLGRLTANDFETRPRPSAVGRRSRPRAALARLSSACCGMSCGPGEPGGGTHHSPRLSSRVGRALLCVGVTL